MKRDQFEQMLAKASRSVQQLNKHLAKECPNRESLYYDDARRRAMRESISGHSLKLKKRIRQSSKPLLNKLEMEWLHKLESKYGPGKVRSQAKKFKLANGCWYCPDFTMTVKLYGTDSGWETAWEVKGKHAWEDAMVKLKVAAHQWPEVRFILVWKKDGIWCTEEVLP